MGVLVIVNAQRDFVRGLALDLGHVLVTKIGSSTKLEISTVLTLSLSFVSLILILGSMVREAFTDVQFPDQITVLVNE